VAIAIRPSAVRREQGSAAAPRSHAGEPLRTECLTPLAVMLGLVMWGVVILLLRALF
jgi:hypothetical protein